MFPPSRLKKCIVCRGFGNRKNKGFDSMFCSIFDKRSKCENDAWYEDSVLFYSCFDSYLVYSINNKCGFVGGSSSGAISDYMKYINENYKLKRKTFQCNGPGDCLYNDRNDEPLNLFKHDSMIQPAECITVKQFNQVLDDIAKTTSDETDFKLKVVKWFADNFVKSDGSKTTISSNKVIDKRSKRKPITKDIEPKMATSDLAKQETKAIDQNKDSNNDVNSKVKSETKIKATRTLTTETTVGSAIETKPTIETTSSSADKPNDIIEQYKQQINFAYNPSLPDYNVETCFDAAVAIMTNTIVYKDLSLADVKTFEESIDWENERDDDNDDPESDRPFVSHVNLETKTFITSLTTEDEDPSRISKVYQWLSVMQRISERHGYNYLIALNKESPKLMRACQRERIDERSIMIVGDSVIKTIYISNRQQIEAKQKQTIELSKSATYTLRDYQKEYIDWMNKEPRAILKLPCGMGKSLIMIYHMMTHKQNSVILVPNIALVEQFNININKFYTGFGQPLPETHKLSTRDKELIISDASKQQIIVSVYNSFVQLFIYPILARKKRENVDQSILMFERFPYIYIDEAHHVILPSDKKQKQNIQTLLNEYDTAASDVMSKIDSDADDFGSLINGLPYYRAFSSLLYAFSQVCCDHSYYFSATINPSNFSKYNMFAAISAGYLCRLNIDLIIDENYNKNNITTRAKIVNLIEYLKKSSYKSIIIYTSRCKTAKEIHDELKHANFSSAVITASMNGIERQNNFDKFKNHELRCLLTVNCISEGVDLPNADTAIFFDEKRSIINIIQCVGRVMRLCDGKLS